MFITIVLKDESGKPVVDSLTGKLVQEVVSSEVAAFLVENESDMKRFKNIDERHFGLVHYTDQAWENMRELSSIYSAEDIYLGTLDDIAEAEHTHYLKRLARCRRTFQMLRDACTQIQWRRYVLHKSFGYTVREIAVVEGCSHVSVIESIAAVERKIKKCFQN